MDPQNRNNRNEPNGASPNGSATNGSLNGKTRRKIVISEFDNIATIMEDDKAVEFIIHRGDILLGDVFLAQVENILPSIDAAFVNVGGDKMGFLHSSDVPGRGDLKNRLQPKQTLLVQVMKEPTGHKGPRVTTNISLPGRFLVMMPESKGISISRKIQEQKERSRLKSVVSLIKPPGVGVIIRTEALEQKESDIQEDFETLLERWQTIVSMADTASPPTLLYRDQDLLYRVIREAVTEDVQELVVDSTFGLQRAQQLLQNWNLDKTIKVSQYTGGQPIMIGTGIDREIKQALQTKVPLPSGGYLYIQPTEALTVVDVNSGKFTSLESQAETIKLTNLEACKEIARQLRLRNIGGMIIVDFIDMESRGDQLKVLEKFENELAPDKSKPQIGQLSDLGLVEMTRHRQGQSLAEIFTKKCHQCTGTGHAIEDFNWAPPNMQGDPRTVVRHASRNMRHKLPLKQSRQQQVPKAQASAHQRQQKQTMLAQVIEPGLKDKASGLPEPGSLFFNRPIELKKSLDTRAAVEKSIVNYFSDKLYQMIGTRLSCGIKLSMMPIGTNAILSRINPKANDIITLVYSIEAGPNIGHSYGDDNGDDDSDNDNDSDNDDNDLNGDDTDAPDSEADGSGKEFSSQGAPVGLNRDEEDQDGNGSERQPVSVALLESMPDSNEASSRYSHEGVNPEAADLLGEEIDLLDSEEEGDIDEDGEESDSMNAQGVSDGKPKRRGRPPKRPNRPTSRIRKPQPPSAPTNA
ncbi:MAG: Rne/Rng family ribonuclease [Vampirovibrionales bacterium]|nr:Rne/Rng family ribonuclease [Vampirovibrionales bacterium]